MESDTDDEDEPDSYVNLWLKYCDDLNISPPIRYRDFEKYGQILVQKPYTTAARYVDAAWKYVRNNAIEVDERDSMYIKDRITELVAKCRRETASLKPEKAVPPLGADFRRIRPGLQGKGTYCGGLGLRIASITAVKDMDDDEESLCVRRDKVQLSKATD